MFQEHQILTPLYRQSQERRQRLEKIEQTLIAIHERINTMSDENRSMVASIDFNRQMDWVQNKLKQLRAS